MEIFLSKRLRKIANESSGHVVADIGCDGANLAVWLAQRRGCKVYACDLRLGPLKKAKANVEKFKMANKVELIQTDGLQGVPSSVDEVIIAGLGGEQIKKIVLNCGWLKSSELKLILQPQSFVVDLKQSLYEAGFALEKQVCVVDRGKAYIIFVFRFCGLAQKLSLKKALTGGLNKFDQNSKAWVAAQKQKLKKTLNGLQCAKQTSGILPKKLKLEEIYSILSEWEVV